MSNFWGAYQVRVLTEVFTCTYCNEYDVLTEVFTRTYKCACVGRSLILVIMLENGVFSI